MPIGKANVTRAGSDLTLLSWGSTMPLCEEAAEAFSQVGIQIEVIDLRTLFPWDEKTLLQSVGKTGKILIVHEDNQTCGLGGEIAATLSEKSTTRSRCVESRDPIPTFPMILVLRLRSCPHTKKL